MSVKALKCKECGERYALEARYVCDVCFGPLEVEYDLSGLDAESTRRRIQAGYFKVRLEMCSAALIASERPLSNDLRQNQHVAERASK